MSTTTIDRVRILVLGDSGVGKSSLVHLIAHGRPLSHITYTIGAQVEVKLHEYKEGTPFQKTFWVELSDVGGFHSHRNARHVFYHNAHGVILVHDLSNKKSQENLDKWLREFMDRESGNSKLRESHWEDDNDRRNEVVDVNVPLLVIGTKQDLVTDKGLPVHQRRSFIAEEYLTEEINVNCQDENAFAPGSSALNKLSRFFDKVIEKQFYRRPNDKGSSSAGPSPSAFASERRRL